MKVWRKESQTEDCTRMNKPLRKVRDQGIITTLGREATIIGKYTEDVDHQVVSLN